MVKNQDSLGKYLLLFLQYVKSPVHMEPDFRNPKYSLSLLFSGFFVLFLVQMFALQVMSTVLNLDEIPHAMEDMLAQFPMYVIFILAVVLAPIIEEMLFRFPIVFFRRWFGVAFYAFTLVFAYLHVYNFSLEGSQVWLTPILILPQLILGFYLAFVRMHFSIFHSMAIHCLNNLIPMTLLIVAKAYGVDLG